MGWKRNVAIGLGALVVIVVIGESLGDAPKDGAASEAAAAPAPALAITARELHEAFAANEVAAKARFDGQALAVTGVVQAVELDLLDNPQVRLAAGNDFEWVVASFEKDDAAVTGALSKGQEITLRCETVTEVIGNPMLDDCQIG